METMNISKNRFSELRPLELPNSVHNTESRIYVLDTKSKWIHELKLLKKFYIDSGPVFSNKLATLNTLIDSQEEIGLDEMVFPEKLASVSGKLVGFTMPYIDSTNLEILLNDYNIPVEDKIKYLKEIGQILRRMQNVRKNERIKDFFLNDLHANNFVVDKKTGKVKVVDLDSASIGGNKPFASKYLSFVSPISKMENKYVKSTEVCSGIYYPNENTDLYCYIMTIMKFLFGEEVYKLSKETYYLYLEYLLKIGIPNDLVSIFSKVYEYGDNENPDYLLDALTPYVYRTNYNVFSKVMGLNTNSKHF